MSANSQIVKLCVAYRTKPIDGVADYLPQFKANGNLKDRQKIAEDLEKKTAEFLETAHEMPYTGTFEEIILSDPQTKKFSRFASQAVESGKSPPAIRCRNYLLQRYPSLWRSDLGDDPLEFEAKEVTKGTLRFLQIPRPRLFFIGFETRTFLKMLGLECSLPSVNSPCPLRLWYDNTDHRDIGDAVMPSEFKRLTLPLVLRFRRPSYDADAVKIWDEKLKTWEGPGRDPQTDLLFVTELATQLGLLNTA